ncbi:MAG TPA: formate dehydrogenase accessory sulfurtransferase FdhD [Dongiaceae bacterium]|nr:formate dehydrogenase accessory sulfurtransferase FdhD [Dongiaceae bacterium]
MTLPIADHSAEALRGAAVSDREAPRPGLQRLDLIRVDRDGTRHQIERIVPDEVPVALVYNGISHVVMMATPLDLEDFALGFSLSEGILADAGELLDIESAPAGDGIELRLQITGRAFAGLKERRRNLTGRTGCGLCGVDSIDQAVRDLPAIKNDRRFATTSIFRALDELPSLQVLNRDSRTLHAAAFCDAEGKVLVLREDVGRHNALDKLIGALRKRKLDPASGFGVITSRCSSEMVQKAVVMGLPMLVAVSAPTGLAQELADRYGLTLIGLARSDSLIIVSEGWRLSEQT